MAQRVRITGGNIDGDDNEARDAQVDAWGNLRVREGTFHGDYKVYADTSFASGDSPATHDFETDTGRTSVDGWIICDGSGSIVIALSRDGLTYQDSYTLKKGEVIDVLRFEISKIKVTHSGTDSSYRILLI